MSARFLLPAALAVAALLSSAEARAVYQCGDQKDDCPCGASNPYPCCDNGGNCTWWAWEAACCNWAVGLPGWGNAKQWAGYAAANSSYHVEDWPVSSSVGCRDSTEYGHVAWVTGLSGSNVEITEMGCWGGYGMSAATRAASHFDGGYITRAGQVECRPGDSGTQGCGACGTQSRGCGNDGKWGGWGDCGGAGSCAPGASESQACGRCGTQSRTCGGDCQWGGWGDCGGEEGECAAGATESQACGNCGTQSRTCGGACAWEGWGECGGEGACVPGQSETVACGECGTAPRSCGETCQWGEPGTCTEAAPGAGCDTGLRGICSVGTIQCADGVATCVPRATPTEESCNGKDDDCDGVADEGCPDAGSASVTPPIAHPDTGYAEVVQAGCGCSAAAAPASGPLALAALGLLRRRRR